MSYTRPTGNAVNFTDFTAGYTRPSGGSVVFNFQTVSGVSGVGAATATAEAVGVGEHSALVSGVGAADVSVSSAGVGEHLSPVSGSGAADVSVSSAGVGEHSALVSGVGAADVSVSSAGVGEHSALVSGVGAVDIAISSAGVGEHTVGITGTGAAVVADTTAAGLGVTNSSSGVGAATVPFTASGTVYFGSYQTEMLFETAAISSAVFMFRRLDLVETLEADDYTVTNGYYVERESAVLTDALYSSVTRAADLAETAELADAVVGVLRVSASLSETAVASGAAVVPNSSATVNEAAALASVTYAQGVRTASVAEQADVGDLTYVSNTALLVDSADLGDSHVVRVRTQQTETALVASTAYLSNAVTIDAVDVAQLGSQTFPASTLRDHRVEVLFVFDDVLEIPDGIAWTANLGNWAMSRYTGFTFNSVVDGFAASEDGVYVPGAGSVAAKFDSGRARMSPGTKARLEYVYTDVETSAPMDVIVTGDTSAGKVTHSYAQVARDLTNTKAAKAKVGKGFSSSYYSVAHSSAAPFVVQKAELLFADSARRI